MIANKPLLWAVLLVGFTLFYLPASSAFTYLHGQTKTIYPHCVNASSGELLGTNANLTVRNETGVFYEVKDLHNIATGVFAHNLTNLSIGHCYTLELICEDDDTWETQWATLCETRAEGENMIIGAIILIPLLLSIIFIIGSAVLGEEHAALKIGLFLLSIPPFFASLHFGLISVIKFYGFTELQDLIGTTTYWIGMIFFILLAYFMIYLFYKATHVAAQKKKERLEY